MLCDTSIFTMASQCSIKGLLEPPSPTQLKTILAEINEESEEKLMHNERLLEEWIKCQNHFPKNIDKGYIRGTLRGCKHVLEKAKEKIESGLAARHLYPEFYLNKSPFAEDILHAMDVTNVAVLPKLTPEGYRICILSLNRFELCDNNVLYNMKLITMIYDLLIASHNMATGDIVIFDNAHVTTGHIMMFFGPIIKPLITLFTRIYPMRIKKLYAINSPTLVRTMVAGIKPLLPVKLKKRIYVYENLGDILEEYGPDLMPSDYGGNLKSVREIALDWYDVAKANADWFQAQENVKITEIPKEIKSSFLLEDQLGVDGSFRKLAID